MQIEGDLPEGVCPKCSKSAINAAEFRSLCQQAAHQWDITITLLHDLPTQCMNNKTIFAIIDKTQMIVINDMKKSYNITTAAQRLTTHLVKPTLDKEDSHYKCPNCEKEFTNAFQLCQHLKESPDLKRACYICGKIMSRDDILYHMINEHKEVPYNCKKCPALFCSYSQYMQHLTKAHSNGCTTCIDCGRNFQSLNAYHAHVSIHASKNCPGCDKMFRNHSCYIYHVKTCCNLERPRLNMMTTKKKVTIEVKNEISKRKVKVGLRGAANKECICDYCKKKFAGKKFVAAHIQIVHMRNTHRPCIYCGKLLASAHMSEHIKIHESDKTYKCPHCGVVLKTKLGYNQHLRLHTGERPYACKYCGETFSASSRRSEHIRKVHKSSDIVLKQECHLCPAKFRLPYRLKQHLKSVHNDDQDTLPKFECNTCHEKFGSCRGLLHHSRKHQNVNFPLKKPEKSIMLKVYSEIKQDNEIS